MSLKNMRKLMIRLKSIVATAYALLAKQSWKVLAPACIILVTLIATGSWMVKAQITAHNDERRDKSADAQQLQQQGQAMQDALPAENNSDQPSTDTTNAATNTPPPHDPRSASPSLQPSPDKPPIPKTQKPLVLNPSSVTIYKNLSGAQGVKGDGVTEVITEVNTGDGRALYYPTSTGSVLLTATNFNPRANWAMKVSSSYTSVGTIAVPLSAVAVDGSASYVGTLHVTVLPLPSFTVTSTAYGSSYNLGDRNYQFGHFNYNDTFNGTHKPAISIVNTGGLTCDAYFTFVDGYVRCGTSHPLPPGVHPHTVVFENQFQKLTFQTQIHVLTY